MSADNPAKPATGEPVEKVRKKRESKIDLKQARLMYETIEGSTASSVARHFGTSRQNINNFVKNHGWKKVGKTPEEKALVNTAAHLRADRMQEKEKPEKDDVESLTDVNVEVSHPSDVFSSIEVSVSRRAEILNRHRSEWNAARSIIYRAMNNVQDLEKSTSQMKLAKSAAEALTLLHKGEREAHGLNSEVKVIRIVGAGRGQDDYDKEPL